MGDKTRILDHVQVEQKINRIAYELFETNYTEPVLYLVGITGQGLTLSNRLGEILQKISGKKIENFEISLNKDNPLDAEIKLSADLSYFNNKPVILVDDVLNSGRTLIYSAHYLLQAPLKKMQTVCLVDRWHRRFPIRADFVGLTLSTTLQEHIEVVFENNNNNNVYLY
ncbi:MAG TPA: phosphoribosyltransferase family protein [Flavobacteriales bacterium]|nr:phosphoribosyltransferase family protein [Flavobacteriales bacterium]